MHYSFLQGDSFVTRSSKEIGLENTASFVASATTHSTNHMLFFVRTLYRVIMNKYNTVGGCVLRDGKLKILQILYSYKIFLYRVIIKT